MAKRLRAYKDFFLFGLSHLTEREAFVQKSAFEADFDAVKPGARAEILRRLEHAEKVIEQHTKPGDLIAFEAPKPCTFEDYCKVYELHIRLGEPQAKQKLRSTWDALMNIQANYYSRLAEYAEKIGRKVVSLEPSIRKHDSSFRRAFAVQPFLTQKWARMDYLLRRKSDSFFLHRVQKLQPKMVVVDGSHALFIENTLKLEKRNVKYFPPLTQSQKEAALSRIKEEHRRYRREKLKRLREGQKKDNARKKKTQRKPRI